MPVRSYTKEDIEQSGQTTVADFLNDLPDVSTSSFATEYGNITGLAGQTTVQLHGLPAGTTLILLNGRRVETSYFGFFDLSSIPASAVERVEILPAGASAIYGADALGGAVNIILRDNLNGFEANGTFGHAADVNDTSANLGWGKSWDRGSIALIGTYQDRGALLGSHRELTSTTTFPAGFPAFLYVAGDCSPGNVYSLNGQNLPGLSSSQAAIPPGISGAPTIQELAGTAGKANQCNNLGHRPLIPYAQQEGALLSGHYQLSESVDLFTETLFSYERIQDPVGPLIDLGPEGGMATLGAKNPYNPFGEAVGISYSYPGIQIGQNNSSTTAIRPLIGVRGSLFSAWHYEATAYVSRDVFLGDETFAGNSTALQAALDSSNPATALNPFTTGAPGTPQLLQSLLAASPPNFHFSLNNQLVDAQALLRGPVFQMPAGLVEAVIGSEYGRERQDTAGVSGNPLALTRNSYALFGETRVPLVATSEHSQQLALTFAGRYDHSNDFGGKATWQGGLLWKPTETLSMSGSYGLSYKAPQLQEIEGVPNITTGGNVGAVDPFRGGQPVPLVTVVFGPNPNLKPETGDSRTLTIAYSSSVRPGFHASLTYFTVNISNYIATHGFQDLINDPSLFPGAVVREPTTPQEEQQGFLGPITQINQISYNFGDLSVAGFDADARYAIDTSVGQFTPSVAIANIYKWQSALTPDSPSIGYVSQATLSGVGWAPRWKGTAALNWKRGSLSANFAGRYIGRYRDYQDVVANSNELGNSWTFDIYARYEVGQALANWNSWLAGAYVSLGAVNLFDKAPPLSYGFPTYDAAEYDIRGRFVYTRIGIKW